MKKNRSLFIGLFVLVWAAFFYGLDYLLFKNTREMGFYSILDVAFLPINVLLVTLLIERLITSKAEQEKRKKMNMVIGAFFNEVGTDLLKRLFDFDKTFNGISQRFLIRMDWTDKTFSALQKELPRMEIHTDSRLSDLSALDDFLASKRDFLLRLLENGNLLEHESFSDLLWALFHLTEELKARELKQPLGSPDLDHISIDIRRTYVLLIRDWVGYMRHLKEDYPFLYSLAVRLNPFNFNAKAEIE
jgi:hypothetical protein